MLKIIKVTNLFLLMLRDYVTCYFLFNKIYDDDFYTCLLILLSKLRLV